MFLTTLSFCEQLMHKLRRRRFVMNSITIDPRHGDDQFLESFPDFQADAQVPVALYVRRGCGGDQTKRHLELHWSGCTSQSR